MSNDNSKLYILSYPRSGNTWVRYIVEFLSKKPTKGYDNRIDSSPGSKVSIGVDLKAEPIAYKSHKIGYKEGDKIIFILRDYKEAISRHAKGGNLFNTIEKRKGHFIQQTEGKTNRDVDYIDVLESYDSWKDEDKLLIYYEDLMLNPKAEILRIIDFMGLKDTYVKEFFDNYKKHKSNSISAYKPGSHTKGDNLKFHSSSFPDTYLEFMTNHLKNNHRKLFDKYLKRYE